MWWISHYIADTKTGWQAFTLPELSHWIFNLTQPIFKCVKIEKVSTEKH